MAKQLLHGTDVGAGIQQMGGEAMPEGMRRYRLMQTGMAGGLVHRALQRGFIEVVAFLAAIIRNVKDKKVIRCVQRPNESLRRC